MVWPFLLIGYLATAVFNLRAGLAFIACLIAIQLIQKQQFDLEQIYYCATYTCIGALVFFFLDRVSGVALALCGIAYALHWFGLVDHRPKMIAAEVILVLGMIASAYGGPSGGFLARHGPAFSGRFAHIDPWWASFAERLSLRN